MLEILAYGFVVLPFVATFVLALLLVLAVFGTYRTPIFGTVMIVGVFVLTTIFGAAAVRLGINLTLPDVVLTLVAVTTLLRMLSGHMDLRDRIVQAWFALGIVWFGLFFVGVARYGATAGVGFRNSFYLWITVAYLLSFRLKPGQLSAATSVFMWGVAALCLLVVYRWVLLSLGARDEFWQESADSARVVSSFGAQMLALGFAFGLAGWAGLARSRRDWTFIALAALPLVVMLQHRTVWIAAVGAVMASLVVGAMARRARLGAILLPLLVCAAVLATLFLILPDSLIAARMGTAADTTTLAWRVDSWRALVTDWAHGGPTVWAAGQPFGSDLTRYIESMRQETSVSAHSHYVGVLVNGGAIGLVAYLLAQLVTLWRLLGSVRHGRRAGEPPRSPALPPSPRYGAEHSDEATPAQEDASDGLLALAVVAIMIYGVAYGTDYLQGVVLGLACSRALQLKGRTTPVDANRAASASKANAQRLARRRVTY